MPKQYVYAIADSATPVPFAVKGLGGASLDMVCFRALSAIVSPICGQVPAVTSNVLCHQTVVEAVREGGPAIPVRFGTILPGPSAVEAALDRGYAVLHDDLTRLADKVEFGATVLWEPPQAPDVAIECVPRTGGPGRRFMAARLGEYRRGRRVRAEAEALTRVLDGALREHSLEGQCRVWPAPRLLFRGAYLVARSDIPGFRESFAQVASAHPDLHLLMTGPWPPYSFVTRSVDHQPFSDGQLEAPRPRDDL